MLYLKRRALVLVTALRECDRLVTAMLQYDTQRGEMYKINEEATEIMVEFFGASHCTVEDDIIKVDFLTYLG